MKNFYDILGVPASAHEQEIKLAYRRLAKRYHPDVNAGDKKSEERFKEIVEAYNTLSDPILKSAYDRKRSGRDLFSNSGFSFDEKKEKRDPRKREYSEEELNRVRALHRKRTLAHIARRKKIFVGMIITFILVIIGGAELENYVEQQRQMNEDSLKKLLSFDVAKIRGEQNQFIENTDSPYDGFFGKAIYQPNSVNNIVIYNYFSDAVVCAVQLDANSRTVRNEFMHPSIDPFVLRYLPDGIYQIKIYSGKNWDMKKKNPNGNMLGGFSSNEAFYKIDVNPFEFISTTKRKKVQASDTIWIDPRIMKMDSISREEFFSASAK